MDSQAIDANLRAIRVELDKKCDSSDIVSVQNNLDSLQSLLGLSAEVVKHSEINLYLKQEEALNSIADRKNYNIVEKIMQGKLAYEIATLTYAKNIFKALEKKIDGQRTIISLYKSELESMLKK